MDSMVINKTVKPLTPVGVKKFLTCKTCGCNTQTCSSNNSLDLHKEIEQLNARLEQVKAQRSLAEKSAMEAAAMANIESLKQQDDIGRLRDRYDRLFENHRRMHKVNHELEEKLLGAVEKLNSETFILQSRVDSLNTKILTGNSIICDLEDECEEYRKDCNIASGLLQCNPANFVSHKISTLPVDLQERVRFYMTSEEQFMLDSRAKDEVKETLIPIPTFPPTAMMYAIPMGTPTMKTSVSASDLDSVPTRLLAEVLSKPSRRKRNVNPSYANTAATSRHSVATHSKHAITAEEDDFHAINSASPVHAGPLTEKPYKTGAVFDL